VAGPPRPLEILILGGTTFLGPHLIRYALERGHTVATFTRGRTPPPIHQRLCREAEALIGDRQGDLEALKGRRWDAVIDTSGRRVSWTRDSARLLKDSADLYLYTSGRTVYIPYLGSDITEDTPVAMQDAPPTDPPSIGVIKANSEAEARQAFGEERTIVVRPTYVVGPADPTNRYPYWPARLARGGEVLAPGKADDPVQYIDVRDLTEFMIRLIENGTTGTFNVAGPAPSLGMHAFLHGVQAAVSAEVSWVMIQDSEFLLEHRLTNVVPWIMPVGRNYGFARINIDRAMAAGLTHRPLATTARETLAWWLSDAVTDERRRTAWIGEPDGFALTPEREQRIIRAWRERVG
jgi:2'-hydroxyisoflavone reductase